MHHTTARRVGSEPGEWRGWLAHAPAQPLSSPRSITSLHGHDTPQRLHTQYPMEPRAYSLGDLEMNPRSPFGGPDVPGVPNDLVDLRVELPRLQLPGKEKTILRRLLRQAVRGEFPPIRRPGKGLYQVSRSALMEWERETWTRQEAARAAPGEFRGPGLTGLQRRGA